MRKLVKVNGEFHVSTLWMSVTLLLVKEGTFCCGFKYVDATVFRQRGSFMVLPKAHKDIVLESPPWTMGWPGHTLICTNI